MARLREFTTINKIDYFILVTIFQIWFARFFSLHQSTRFTSFFVTLFKILFARFLEFTPINKIDDKNESHKNDDKIGVDGGVTTYMVPMQLASNLYLFVFFHLYSRD